MKSNKCLGNTFEEEFCEILSKNGFWVHNMAQNQAGQPADVIAVKNRIPILVDSKVCTNDKFPLSRIEENQRLSMELWEKCGNGYGWFALKTSDGIVMLSAEETIEMARRKSTWNTKDILSERFGVKLEGWL